MQVHVDAAEAPRHSSIVTVMARNGTDFGIRISSLPAAGSRARREVDGLYLPGFGDADATPDIGDSVDHRDRGHRRIRHGRSAGDRPVRRRHARGRARVHAAHVRDHGGGNDAYQSPRSISGARRPASTSARSSRRASCPAINTGIAHREPGIGMVGAGLVKPPENCFQDALAAFADAVRGKEYR